MCRLFGQISSKPNSAYDFLVEHPNSLLKQSNCNHKHLQKDGWGIARLPSTRRFISWEMVKSPRPIFAEKEQFRKISQETKSKIILAHIRHASNPKKLPKNRLIGLENTQPFSFRNLVFIHNGTLNIPDEVASSLGIYSSYIGGTNDSEVLFWLFVKTWFQYSTIRNTSRLWQKIISQMIKNILSIWNKIQKSKGKPKTPFQGLNFIVTDGQSLAALCYYDRAEGKSLCGQNRPYFEMCYTTLSNKVVVASELMDKTNYWSPIPNKHFLVVNQNCGTSLLKL